MPRLTDKQKAEVIKDYAAGKSVTEIAEKFTVSKTAISKILKNGESLQNVKKLTKSSTELRKDIISRATEALYNKDFDNLPSETLLKIIERLSILEDDKKNEELKIVVEKKVVDLSGGKDGDKV